MTTDDTHRMRARNAINAARRGHLPKPKSSNIMVTTPPNGLPLPERNFFETAQQNSIEVYDDKFGRNTILTRSARMRKFKFYQYKPIQDSMSTPKNIRSKEKDSDENSTNGHAESKAITGGTHNVPKLSFDRCMSNSPLLMPRDDVLQGKVTLLAEQSKELVDLDQNIVELEKKISDLNNGCNDRNVDNLDEIFSLVNKKNDLLRRQMQLNIIEQERALERANEELTKELRSLMSIDDSRKSRSQLERQQYLYDQSLALVNKRNELVHHMDVQERGIEDDIELKATLKSVISNTATRNKLSRANQDQNCIIQ